MKGIVPLCNIFVIIRVLFLRLFTTDAFESRTALSATGIRGNLGLYSTIPYFDLVPPALFFFFFLVGNVEERPW